MSGDKEQMRVLFIGNELDVVQSLSEIREIDIVACICQKNKSKCQNAPSEKYIVVESKSDFLNQISAFYEKVDFAIMYSFGIIIPREVIDKIKIYNFHPGNLRTNRGSSPIHWSILLNEDSTMMTLHCVDAEIDSGKIITEHECRVYSYDVPYTLRKRMEGEIASMTTELLCLLKNNVCGGGYKVDNGTYRSRITEDDYTIKDGDSREIVNAKIRSQYQYKGAILYRGEQKFFVRSLEEYDALREDNNNEIPYSRRRDTCDSG